MSVLGVKQRSLKGRLCAPLPVPNASQSDVMEPGLVETLDGGGQVV